MRPQPPRRRVRDVVALVMGGVLFLVVVELSGAIVSAWDFASCSGEWRPFLGSGRQAFATYGCLARDAGPLIDIKKALRIYDPRWKTIIK